MGYNKWNNILAIIIITSFGKVSLGQCNNNVTLTDEYTKGVYGYIHPPDPEDSLVKIRISIIVSSALVNKIIIQEKPKKYEIFKGIAEPSVAIQLSELNKSCELPQDPYAINRIPIIKMKWSRYEITKDEFDELHAQYIKALMSTSQYIQRRKEYITKRGGVIYMNRTWHEIIYDDGNEKIIIDTDDMIKGINEICPMYLYVKNIEKIIERKDKVNNK
jgi:hypothetical protein